MLVKIHNSYRDAIAICDSELLGKKFEQGNFELEISGFFNGDEKSERETLNILKEGAKEDVTFNIVGEKSVALALKSGIISEQGIKKIQDVPFALVLL